MMAPAPRRPLLRVALAASAVFVGVAVIWMSVGRARVGTSSSAEPAKPPAAVELAARPTAAPAFENAAPAVASPAPAPAPPSETPPAPTAAVRPGALHVDSILVSASYKNFTCPDPARRISVRSTRNVNVCLQVAHKPGRTERLTLVWQRNGAFAGKTPVEIPASKPNARTRVHMKISANRLGPWSVRVVSDHNAPLAETTFDVVP